MFTKVDTYKAAFGKFAPFGYLNRGPESHGAKDKGWIPISPYILDFWRSFAPGAPFWLSGRKWLGGASGGQQTRQTELRVY